MAQHDYDIANQSGANFRADLNNALDAIVSNNSGSSEPSTTFAYEWWIDTSANVLKLRNSANNAWITLPLSITADNSTSGALTVNGNLSTTGTLDVNGGEVILDADADTSITADTDDQIDFKIGNVDVATLTNSHLVLKGTTPKITIGDGGEEDTALIFDGNAQDFYIGLDDSADDLIIGKGSTVGTTPAISIDENLKSTFAGVVDADAGITVDNITIDGAEIDLSSGSLTVDAAQNILLDHDSGHSLVLQGSGTSYGSFFINNTTNLAIATAISNGGIEFFANGSERMRILSNGQILIGQTSLNVANTGAGIVPNDFMFITNNLSDSTERLQILNRQGVSSAGEFTEFRTANTERGTISFTGSVMLYGGSSDYRLKENVVPMQNALDRVKLLNPITFNWIETGIESEGFLAHELQEVCKDAVNGEKDAERMQMADYGKLTPMLVKAVQELEARVKTLEE